MSSAVEIGEKLYDFLPEYKGPQPALRSVLSSEHVELLTGRSNPELAQAIADILMLRLDRPTRLFPDGEADIEIGSNMRRKHAIIIQSTSRNLEGDGIVTPNDSLVELILMIDAARRASAQEVTAVVPYFGYGRKDRKEKPRVPISASRVAKILMTAGANRILTVDIHAEQEGGFIDEPWDNLYAAPVLLDHIKLNGTNNTVVVSPDTGGVKRAVKGAEYLGVSRNIAIINKVRIDESNSEALSLVGNVKGKRVVMIDDILAGGATMDEGTHLLEREGAESVDVVETHGVFTKGARERLDTAFFNKLYVTDTVRIPKDIRDHPKVVVCSVAPLLAEAIRRIETGESLSELFPTTRQK